MSSLNDAASRKTQAALAMWREAQSQLRGILETVQAIEGENGWPLTTLASTPPLDPTAPSAPMHDADGLPFRLDHSPLAHEAR
jgi:hypothetical protein